MPLKSAKGIDYYVLKPYSAPRSLRQQLAADALRLPDVSSVFLKLRLQLDDILSVQLISD